MGASWAALMLCGAGCTANPNPINPRVLNRPARVTLVCFDGDAPVALARCADTATMTTLRLLALIPQARGDVAAIDVTANRVLDSDRRAPGFTFVAAGEAPVGIAVDDAAPNCVFVANAGSRTVTAIPTCRFRGRCSDGATGDEVSLTAALPGTAAVPQAIEMQDGAIFVALPDDHLVARIEVTNDAAACSFGAVEGFAVPTDALLPRAAPPPAAADTPSLAMCPPDLPLRPVATIDPPELVTPVAEDFFPWAFERDPSAGLLYVADVGAPRIHRFRTRPPFGFEPSIAADGPTSALAITPPVPSAQGGAPDARYLYAVDASDGSVMVYDVSDPTAESFGSLLPVDVEGAIGDRLAIPVAARALEVLDVRPTVEACVPGMPREPSVAPLVLRGVFLAVGAADGTMRIVDVYDRDAACRGEARGASGEAACSVRGNGADDTVLIRRHRPRFAGFIRQAVTVRDAPRGRTTTTSGPYSPQVVGSEVLARAVDGAPDLAPVACESGLGPLYFDGTTSFVCGVVDPWSVLEETWSLRWEGTIQGAVSVGNLALDGETIVLDTRLDACARGIVGPDGVRDLSGSAPELVGFPVAGSADAAPYPGDAIAITSGLPGDLGRDPGCLELVGGMGMSQADLVIPIEAVITRGGMMSVPGEPIAPYRTRFVLRPLSPGGASRAEEVFRCFGDELVDFEVRTRNAFAVAGSRTGFRARVVRSEVDGHCVFDPDDDLVRRQGRAGAGVAFQGERLAVLARRPTGDGAVVELDIDGAPAPLAVNIGSACGTGTATALPVDILWSATDQRVYVLDELRRGLVRLNTPALTVATPCFE